MNRFFFLKYLLAGRPSTSKATLTRLAAGRSSKLRARVAENKNCPESVLAALAFDNSVDVRIAVALNEKTSENILKRLSSDTHPDVRMMIASAAYIPSSILEGLYEDENPYVAWQAKSTCQKLRSESDKNAPGKHLTFWDMLIPRLYSQALWRN